MTGAWPIAKRELASFFRLPLGWVVVALFLFLSAITFVTLCLVSGVPATLRGFFDLLDATDGVREKPDASVLKNVDGKVVYENVTFRFKNSDQGVFDASFAADAGKTPPGANDHPE